VGIFFYNPEPVPGHTAASAVPELFFVHYFRAGRALGATAHMCPKDYEKIVLNNIKA